MAAQQRSPLVKRASGAEEVTAHPRRPWDATRVTWTIRTTLAADRQAVLALVREAFSGEGHDGRQRDGREEVEIVDRTWRLGVAPAGLDLVAVEFDGLLIGHVIAAPGRLRTEGAAAADRPVLAIAPLAVRPSRQRQGVGGSLMREVLSRAERAGARLVLLLGDPGYYQRFGFEPAGAYGIVHPPGALNDPHFMIRRLGPLGEGWRGAFAYCWEDALGGSGSS